MAQMAWVLVWRATFLSDLRWMQYWRISSARDQVGGLAVELAELADAGAVGLLGARALRGRSFRSSAKDFRMACGELFLYAWSYSVND